MTLTVERFQTLTALSKRAFILYRQFLTEERFRSIIGPNNIGRIATAQCASLVEKRELVDALEKCENLGEILGLPDSLGISDATWGGKKYVYLIKRYFGTSANLFTGQRTIQDSP
jgi:hypothetical protein